jgi:hypothetical protein
MQELFNAKYFGYFKQSVYKLSNEFYKFWTTNGIFSDTKIMRMAEAELVTDLLIAILDGIQSKKSAEKYYQKYDDEFPQKDIVELNFRKTIDLMGNIYGDELKSSNFKRPPVFYGLFVSLYHLNYGIRGLTIGTKTIEKRDYPKIKNVLEEINNILEMEIIPDKYQAFVNSVNKATTDIPSRSYRCNSMSKFIFDRISDE